MQRDCVTHAILIPALHLDFLQHITNSLVLLHGLSSHTSGHFLFHQWVILKDLDFYFIVFCQVQIQTNLTGFLRLHKLRALGL